MARIDDLTHILDLSGPLPVLAKVHYWAEVDGLDDVGIMLGFIEIYIDGKHVGDLEGAQIPESLAEKAMGAIPSPSIEDRVWALAQEEDQAQFEREHAVGRL